MWRYNVRVMKLQSVRWDVHSGRCLLCGLLLNYISALQGAGEVDVTSVDFVVTDYYMTHLLCRHSLCYDHSISMILFAVKLREMSVKDMLVWSLPCCGGCLLDVSPNSDQVCHVCRSVPSAVKARSLWMVRQLGVQSRLVGRHFTSTVQGRLQQPLRGRWLRHWTTAVRLIVICEYVLCLLGFIDCHLGSLVPAQKCHCWHNFAFFLFMSLAPLGSLC